MKHVLTLLLLGTVLAGCAMNAHERQTTRSTDPGQVVGKTWQWVSTVTPVDRVSATAPERYTILLHPQGKVQARFDCNRGGGEYEMAQGKLTFKPMMATRMACPPGSQDSRFMRDLQQTVSFFLEQGHLYLELPLDSGTMKFRMAPQ